MLRYIRKSCSTQGQATETNVQPEQTTVAGEQGVSIDLNEKKKIILINKIHKQMKQSKTNRNNQMS